jgi:hypothetical protein
MDIGERIECGREYFFEYIEKISRANENSHFSAVGANMMAITTMATGMGMVGMIIGPDMEATMMPAMEDMDITEDGTEDVDDGENCPRI